MTLSILLPTDGSPSAIRAARWLGSHLHGHPQAITLLHVMAPRIEYGTQDLFIEAREHSEKVLEDTEAALGCCPSVETVSVIGAPEEEIVRFAVDHGIGLIVMGRRCQRQNWVGTVSFAVFQRSPIPVAIVEPEP